MKKTLTNTVIIILVAIVIGTILDNKFNPNIVSNTISDTVYQDTGSVKYYPNPYPVYIDTGSTDTVKFQLPVDSAEITKAYIELHKKFFATYFYKDTLKNDSSAFISVGTKITQNKPVSYDLIYFNKAPSVINNTTNIYSKNEIMIGIDAGENLICPNLLYKTKKGYIFGVGYNTQNNGVVFKAGININSIIKW